MSAIAIGWAVATGLALIGAVIFLKTPITEYDDYHHLNTLRLRRDRLVRRFVCAAALFAALALSFGAAGAQP